MNPQAVCALIYNNENKILAVSRRNKPNDWNLPGGKVDEGETLSQACVREVYEETGIKIKNLQLVYSHLCEGESDYHVSTFIAEFEGTPGIKEPGINVSWIDKSVLLQEGNSFRKYNKELLDLEKIRRQEKFQAWATQFAPEPEFPQTVLNILSEKK
jgi:mutator protein MutT